MGTLIGGTYHHDLIDLELPEPLEDDGQTDGGGLVAYDCAWEGCVWVLAYGGIGPSIFRCAIDWRRELVGEWVRMANMWPGLSYDYDVQPRALWTREREMHILATANNGDAFYWWRDLGRNIIDFEMVAFPAPDQIDTLLVAPRKAHVEVMSTTTGARWYNIAHSGWTRLTTLDAVPKKQKERIKKLSRKPSEDQVHIWGDDSP